MKNSVLIVDDDPSMGNLVKNGLTSINCEGVACTSADSALQILSSCEFDIVITDVRMSGTNGIELCSRIVDIYADIPVIVMTAFGNMEMAIQAIRAGAYDFITKPFKLDAMRIAVQRALNHRSLVRQVKQLSQALEYTKRFDEIWGSCSSMQKVFNLIERVASSYATVLITGESGTGKELIARALHNRSDCKQGPFLAINCAAMPETLLESELFGHTRGAFTDAKTTRAGLLLEANKGSIFLDEVGELPLGLQPKLLRALQERVVRPLGGARELPFDARIIAATNQDLEKAVAQKRFREDLLYRINVIQIEVPPLRARGNDILLLAKHFVDFFASIAGKQVKGIHMAAAKKLLAYNWPGNVRELKNCIERAVIMACHDTIMVEDLPERLTASQSSSSLPIPAAVEALMPMEEIEKRYILHVLEAVEHNKSAAASVLGFDRRTLYRKLQRIDEIELDESD